MALCAWVVQEDVSIDGDRVEQLWHLQRHFFPTCDRCRMVDLGRCRRELLLPTARHHSRTDSPEIPLQLLWLLYFTSEEGTFFVNLFDSRSRGGFSRGTINQQRGSNHRASMANGGAAVSYSNAQYSGVKGGLGGGPAGMSVGDLSGAGHAEEGGHSPNMGGTSLMDGQGGQPEYLLKARALYSCTSLPTLSPLFSRN